MTQYQFFRIVEMRTKIISMGTFFAALVYAFNLQGTIMLERAIIMLFATLCVDMGTTGFNTFFDYYHGVDNKEYTKEQEKVLVHEDVKPAYALFVSLALFGLAALLGLYLAYLTSYGLIIVGSLCMLVGFFYTAGPLPISRTPFGELFAGAFLGSILFLITLYTQDVPLNVGTVLVSMPFLLLIAMILSVNNGCDRIGDQASGRRTLAILLGQRGAYILIAVEAFSAYALSLLLIILGYYPIIMAICTIFVALQFEKSYKKVGKAGMSEEHKSKHMGFASQTYLLYCLAFILSFLIDSFMY
ncbi:MAG: prenyltransferase [Spirochaetia bacterium]|nr:prenyltransferase [Spirochaetia bacterium]